MVRTGLDFARLDVTVQTEPVVQVVHERLCAEHRTKRSTTTRTLLETDPPLTGSGDIVARWNNARQGRNPPVLFRATRLLATQVATRVPTTAEGQRAHVAAARVLAALRSVFALDPVPHQMRLYWPRRDELLRRNAENLSAAIAALRESPANSQLLREAMSTLNEQSIADVGVSASDLDDVMLFLDERIEGQQHPVSARLMSDGSLRFLAILAALMQAPATDAVPELATATADPPGQTTLVIEELENGLHASQAGMLMGLVR